MRELKQWDLPKGAKCLVNGTTYWFAGQDGMYGKWKMNPDSDDYGIALFNGTFQDQENGTYEFITKE